MLICLCWPDGSHGCAEEFALWLGQHGLKNFWLLMAVSGNLRHGRPEHQDNRHHQLQKAMGFLWKEMCPKTSQLFQEIFLKTWHELKAAAV